MDTYRFDALARALEGGFPRRAALAGALGAALAAVRHRLAADEATVRRRKKKKKRCKGGKKTCGKKCCAPGTCVKGRCCPAARACGTVCCQPGQICADRDAGICVVGQGTCAAGASSCGSVDPIFCNGTGPDDAINCACFQATNGATRCARPIVTITPDDCGHCATDADCEQLFPEIIGVFCGANAIGFCGCQAGENLCAAPCPVA